MKPCTTAPASGRGICFGEKPGRLGRSVRYRRLGLGAVLALAALFLLASCGERINYSAKAAAAAKKRDWPAAFELADKGLAAGGLSGKALAELYRIRAKARVGLLNRGEQKDPEEFKKALLPLGKDAALATAADPANLEAAELYYGLVAVVTAMDTMRWFKDQPREAVNRNQLANYREGLARNYIRRMKQALAPETAAKAKAMFDLEEKAHQDIREKILSGK